MVETTLKIQKLSKDIEVTNNYIELSIEELKLLKSIGGFAEFEKEEKLNYYNLNNKKNELVLELLNLVLKLLNIIENL